MIRTVQSFSTSARLGLVCGAAAAAVAVAAPAMAMPAYEKGDNVTLRDGNAVARFDNSDAALTSLNVDGVEQAKRQQFFYRIGKTGPEHSFDSLKITKMTLSDSNPPLFYGEPKGGKFKKEEKKNARDVQPLANLLNVQYKGKGFTVGITYDLTGGEGAGAAELAETIKVTNTSKCHPLKLHLFEYDHFTLDGSVCHNTASIVGGNTAEQTGPENSSAEVAVNPDPTHYQVGLNHSILNSLKDKKPTTLNDFAGPVTGKAEFAFEWDKCVGQGQSFLLSKVKTVSPAAVPLPPAAWSGLATLAGLGTVAGFRRRVRTA